jgi:zinc transport system substrate-binding protein
MTSSRSLRRTRHALVATLLTLPLAACADRDDAAAGGAGQGRPAGVPLKVAASFYPYAFLAERVGGPDVQVDTLTQPGVEPHDLELTPRQVADLGTTDLVVYGSGFQPAVDDLVEQQSDVSAFDVHEVVTLAEGAAPDEDDAHGDEPADAHGDEHDDDRDPHVWLDPIRFAEIGQALAARLGELAPEQAEDFASRATTLATELRALDEQLRQGLAGCERREIVTSHDAFGYLAERYDLEQIAVTGLTPEDEPTPRRLAEVARLAKERGVTTIFFEELVSPRTAESLAREVGARATVLSPLEGPPEQGDYLSAMRSNLAVLQSALGCT